MRYSLRAYRRLVATKSQVIDSATCLLSYEIVMYILHGLLLVVGVACTHLLYDITGSSITLGPVLTNVMK